MGSEGAGKTNIRRIIIGKRFKRNVSPTIGSDFSYMEVYSNETNVQSMIWDLSGNGKYKSSRSLYLQGIQGGFLVFDITDENSFFELEGWVTDIEQSTANRGGIPLIILANKSDLIPISESVVEETKIVEFVNSLRQRFQFKFEINYILTSASTGENIEDAFLQLISNVQNWLNNRKIQ